jgi:hypothetical protein
VKRLTRAEKERIVRTAPDSRRLLDLLGLIDAGPAAE